MPTNLAALETAARFQKSTLVLDHDGIRQELLPIGSLTAMVQQFCADDAELFQKPLALLGEVFASCDLDLHSEYVVAAGFDPRLIHRSALTSRSLRRAAL